jgi:hypothetical protein
MPEKAYLSQIIVVPSFRRDSMVDLFIQKCKSTSVSFRIGMVVLIILQEEKGFTPFHFPTIGREEEVDGVVVELGG